MMRSRPSSPNAFFICVTRSMTSCEWLSGKCASAFGVACQNLAGRPRGRARVSLSARPSASSAARCWRTAMAVMPSFSASVSAATGPSRLTRSSTARRPVGSLFGFGMADFLKFHLAKSKGTAQIYKSRGFHKGRAMPTMTPTGLTRASLESKGRKLFRKDGKQILLLVSGGKIFAIANRCPHEGYPLSDGTEGPGAVLTCNWHNWKFDLSSGAALIGRDPVRTYKIEERDGEIFIDLSDPPPERLCARALHGLDAALADNDMARMAREVARLERAGFDAKAALVHALRARSDAARLAALLEPLAHLAWDTEGAGVFPYADIRTDWEPRAFVAAVEAEDERAAIGLVRGALAAQ